MRMTRGSCGGDGSKSGMMTVTMAMAVAVTVTVAVTMTMISEGTATATLIITASTLVTETSAAGFPPYANHFLSRENSISMMTTMKIHPAGAWPGHVFLPRNGP